MFESGQSRNALIADLQTQPVVAAFAFRGAQARRVNDPAHVESTKQGNRRLLEPAIWSDLKHYPLGDRAIVRARAFLDRRSLDRKYDERAKWGERLARSGLRLRVPTILTSCAEKSGIVVKLKYLQTFEKVLRRPGRDKNVSWSA